MTLTFAPKTDPNTKNRIFVRIAAKEENEPNPTDAAQHMKGRVQYNVSR